MTATQYSTMSKELWQDIGAIADNENLMRRLARGEGMAMLPGEDLTAFIKRNGYDI